METKPEPNQSDPTIQLPVDDQTVVTVEYYLYREDASSLTIGIQGLTEISHSDSFIQLPKELIKFHRFAGPGSKSILALQRWLAEKKKLTLHPRFLKDYVEWQERIKNPEAYRKKLKEEREARIRLPPDPFREMFEQCPLIFDDKETSDD